MTENKRFKIRLADIWELIDYKTKTILAAHNIANELIPVRDLLNELHEENEQLREALKNSYINEICENCKYGHYWISESYGFGLEGDFECTKKHFGNDHWKCDGLKECDDFELDLKGDDVE